MQIVDSVVSSVKEVAKNPVTKLAIAATLGAVAGLVIGGKLSTPQSTDIFSKVSSVNNCATFQIPDAGAKLNLYTVKDGNLVTTKVVYLNGKVSLNDEPIQMGTMELANKYGSALVTQEKENTFKVCEGIGSEFSAQFAPKK